jgi:hypothetical protein
MVIVNKSVIKKDLEVDESLLVRKIDENAVLGHLEEFDRVKRKYASKGSDLVALVEKEFFNDPRHIKLWDEFEIKVRGELSIARILYNKKDHPMYHEVETFIYRNGHRLNCQKELDLVMWELADNSKGAWRLATTEQEIKDLVGIGEKHN